MAELPASALTFSPALLDYCKTNACGNYNKSWTCPPACGSIEEQKQKILSYDKLLVFTTKHNLEDSFDHSGMLKGREFHALVTEEIKKNLPETLVYGAGRCSGCLNNDNNYSCFYPEPCPFPEKRTGSIEAAGIDVTELSKAAGINYFNGVNTVTFFTIVLQKT